AEGPGWLGAWQKNGSSGGRRIGWGKGKLSGWQRIATPAISPPSTLPPTQHHLPRVSLPLLRSRPALVRKVQLSLPSQSRRPRKPRPPKRYFGRTTGLSPARV